jgi:hypothetical protein
MSQQYGKGELKAKVGLHIFCSSSEQVPIVSSLSSLFELVATALTVLSSFRTGACHLEAPRRSSPALEGFAEGAIESSLRGSGKYELGWSRAEVWGRQGYHIWSNLIDNK